MKKRKFDHIFRLIIVASIVTILVWGGVFGYEYYKKHLPIEPITPSIDEEQNQNTNVGGEGNNGKDDNNGNGNGGGDHIDEPATEEVFVNDASMFNYMTTEDGEVIVGLRSTGALKSSKIILPVKTEDGKRVVGVVGNAFLGNEKIEELIIPGSYKFIGEFAFSEVNNLKRVYIGLNCLGTATNRPDASAELVIGAKAFKDCVALEEVYIYKTVSAVDGSVFVGADSINKFLIDSTAVLNSLATSDVFGASVIEIADIYVESVIDSGSVELLNSRYLEASEVVIDGVNYNYYQCKGKIYTLTIDTDGGKIVGENQISFTKYDNVQLPTPTKDHYEFSYYELSNGKSVAVPFIMRAGVDEDIVATAKYIPMLYKVNYELNGGENNSDSIQLISILSGSVELKDAVKADYTFEGWYLDEDLTKKVTTISYKDLTTNADGKKVVQLYAKYLPTNYSINYELDGGENNSENAETINILSDTVELKDAYKYGFLFEGWYLDAEFTKEVSTISFEDLVIGEDGDKSISVFAKFGSMFNIEGNVVLGLNDKASALNLEDIEISKDTVGLERFEIGEGAFVAMSTLKVLRLGEGVRFIREDAFRSCYNLETITMEYDGYTEIMPNAFVGCSNLKEVIIDGAKTIFVQIFDASTLECTKKYAFNATSERLVLELTASYTSSELRKVTKIS